MYRPLPDSLTIKNSKVHGLGVFATKRIPKGTKLGMTHLRHIEGAAFQKSMMIRTPLGGFYNHSDNPNCEKYQIGLGYFLRTIKDIEVDEELTVTYTLYEVKDNESE